MEYNQGCAPNHANTKAFESTDPVVERSFEIDRREEQIELMSQHFLPVVREKAELSTNPLRDIVPIQTKNGKKRFDFGEQSK